MKVDKEQFDALLGKMLSKPPKKTSEIRMGKEKKAQAIIPPKPSQK